MTLHERRTPVRDVPQRRFSRCLSRGFESLLLPGKPLRLLVDNAKLSTHESLQLEPYFREKNRLMLFEAVQAFLNKRAPNFKGK